MAEVFSYKRFSSKKQGLGDSLRRQTEGDKWIARNGHRAANLTLQDLGVSAFRGKNKETGALGEFLKAIESGRVKKGSILLVENLDRLSRQGVNQAYRLFLDILDKGIKIAVLQPTEQIYDSESTKDLVGILIPIIHFHLAWVESENKSIRVKAAHAQKRKGIEEGEIFNKRCPAWIFHDEKSQTFRLKPDAKPTIELIFRKTIEGIGQKRLVRELQKSGICFTENGWNSSYISKLLSDRAVFGEFQPKILDESGNRVPHGPARQNYYPAAISESLFLEAQASKSLRKHRKGPSKGDFTNLFSGLLQNSHDGHPMHIQTTRSKTGVQKRLVSYGSLKGMSGSDSVTVGYQEFESLFLNYVSELQLSDLSEKNGAIDLESKLRELEGINNRLDELGEVLTDPDSKNLSVIVKSVANLEAKKEKLEAEIDLLKGEINSENPLKETQSVISLIEKKNSAELRLRLRAAIGNLVKRIYVKPEKHFGRVYCMALIEFKSGDYKQIHFCPGGFGGSMSPINPNEISVDLRDQKACRKHLLFRELATLFTQPAEVRIPKVIPETLREAADVWLLTMRAKSSKENYRMIPSKIARFVELLGEDMEVRRIDQKTFQKWKEWLVKQVEKNQLSENTARVNYNRVKELLDWLVDQGKTPRFPLLDRSAAKQVNAKSEKKSTFSV